MHCESQGKYKFGLLKARGVKFSGEVAAISCLSRRVITWDSELNKRGAMYLLVSIMFVYGKVPIPALLREWSSST